MLDDRMIETATVGNEGLVGLPRPFMSDRSPNRVIVQVPGRCSISIRPTSAVFSAPRRRRRQDLRERAKPCQSGNPPARRHRNRRRSGLAIANSPYLNRLYELEIPNTDVS